MTGGLYWLTLTVLMGALLWLPYVFERIFRIGLWRTLGYDARTGTARFEQPDETPAAWARRAHAAHLNLLESLPLFAVLMLIAEIAELDIATLALAAQVYFFARVAHYIAYLASVPVLRTLSFFAGVGALLTVAYTILMAA